ncbi:MAG: glycosyltransferase family 2 protein, partial [Acidimicrobiia bacterium]|nr:glycosyltransferase family 2 protein [Acidimicrobiia bacterium]
MSESDGSTQQPATPAVVPSVVAVVVTHNPGPWFEETMQSLVDQDYRNLSILVIDAASTADPTRRVAEVAPDAFVRRLASNPGYSAAANLALRMVEGAAFFVFCHDDVALGPSAVRFLVEEAYRSNAGVVGPKLVHWDEPERLLQVGLGSDKFACPAPVVERGELDQEQHDAVRDVFTV